MSTELPIFCFDKTLPFARYYRQEGVPFTVLAVAERPETLRIDNTATVYVNGYLSFFGKISWGFSDLGGAILMFLFLWRSLLASVSGFLEYDKSKTVFTVLVENVSNNYLVVSAKRDRELYYSRSLLVPFECLVQKSLLRLMMAASQFWSTIGLYPSLKRDVMTEKEDNLDGKPLLQLWDILILYDGRAREWRPDDTRKRKKHKCLAVVEKNQLSKIWIEGACQ